MKIILIIFVSLFNMVIPQTILTPPHLCNESNDCVEKPRVTEANNFMEHWKNLSLENLTEVVNGITYTEEWMDIIGWEGFYQISSFGRTKSVDRWIKNSVGVNRFYAGIILTPYIDRDGYAHVGLINRKVKKIPINYIVHRLVATAFIPNPENKPEVNHLFGVKTDNRYTQLEWSTCQENMNHAILNGYYDRGEESYRAKFEMDDVYDMKIVRQLGWGIKKISDFYKVNKITAYRVLYNKNYKSNPIILDELALKFALKKYVRVKTTKDINCTQEDRLARSLRMRKIIASKPKIKVIDTISGTIYNCTREASELLEIEYSKLQSMLRGKTLNKTNLKYLK